MRFSPRSLVLYLLNLFPLTSVCFPHIISLNILNDFIAILLYAVGLSIFSPEVFSLIFCFYWNKLMPTIIPTSLQFRWTTLTIVWELLFNFFSITWRRSIFIVIGRLLRKLILLAWYVALAIVSIIANGSSLTSPLSSFGIRFDYLIRKEILNFKKEKLIWLLIINIKEYQRQIDLKKYWIRKIL